MKVAALAGGVGGAKMVQGLSALLSPDELTVIVNTGDDFTHLGLSICPDLDTVCYTLAGMVNSETGWGRTQESWNALKSLEILGEPTWFKIGDSDLSTHIVRSERLRQGKFLSEITQEMCRHWQVEHKVLPMTNDRVSTQIQTDGGAWLDFQDYFVRQSWQPKVKDIRFVGVEKAKPTEGILEAIDEADLVVICPSNPFVSIDPILAVHGILNEIKEKITVAVSPIIGGQAVKGPLAKMILELMQAEPSAELVAGYYANRINLSGFLIDEVDDKLTSRVLEKGIICKAVPTLMTSLTDRIRLAKDVLMFGEQIIADHR